jgi:hypothetical protein
MTLKKLALGHSVPKTDPQYSIHRDPNLKKSGSLEPAINMKERVRMCEAFLAMVSHSYMLMKDNIITIDKSAVLF